VNDLAGALQAPAWLRHVGIDADAMHLPDLVFPAFLFIAGVSIPLAFGRALARGQTRRQLRGKILGRTLALLVMGVVMANMEEHEPWARGRWGVLAYGALFLAFAVVPGKPGRAANWCQAPPGGSLPDTDWRHGGSRPRLHPNHAGPGPATAPV
jgi:predicted acyltransferase